MVWGCHRAQVADAVIEAEMRAFYPVFQVVELAAGYRYMTVECGKNLKIELEA